MFPQFHYYEIYGLIKEICMLRKICPIAITNFCLTTFTMDYWNIGTLSKSHQLYRVNVEMGIF